MKMRNWLLERARLSGDRFALQCGGRRVDFRELAELSLRTAHGLRGRGVAAGDGVAILLGNDLDFVCAVHAVALCGARLLPLNARLTASELALQLDRSHARHLVHGAGELAERARTAIERMPAGGCRALDVGRLDAATEPGGDPGLEAHVDLGAIFAVLFTSGTSGEPKGVCLTHGNFHASALATALHLGLREDDRWLACLPLFHIGGLSILMRNALLGTPVLLHERFDPEQVSAAIDEGISHVSLVPTMLGRLLEVRAGRPAPASLRGILLGGAAASPLLLERAHKLGFALLPSYGLTEACSQVATALPGEFDATSASLGSAGRALFGSEIRIADESGAPLPPGGEGEILVRGPTVMAGYLDDAAASARALRGGWLHTGDVGALDRSGRLRVFDRRVDLVVSGGENVSPAEVEAVLMEHPDVAEVGVGGLPDADLGSKVTAWVVARDGARCSVSELERFCRRRLAGFKVPREIRFVPELPRNSSGKLLRRCLAELAPAQDASQSERV